ncbi:MAG: NIL domain-containing protein, partial [Microcoleus sp. Co-bin12]|nr:NIL domain-containing protein [Microcoleus sp. Co-bin12]
HGLTVNIAAALLGPNARDDGWFDLELRGTTKQIQSGLIYLDELDLELWGELSPEEDGW